MSIDPTFAPWLRKRSSKYGETLPRWLGSDHSEKHNPRRLKRQQSHIITLNLVK
jgi:hypothetical protein